MSIIKSSQYGDVTSHKSKPISDVLLRNASSIVDVPKSILDEADRQAKVILLNAKTNAEDIINSANKYRLDTAIEIQKIRNKVMAEAYTTSYETGEFTGEINGYEIGYENGYNDGYQEVAEKSQAMLDELSNMIEHIGTIKSDILKKYYEEIEQVAFAIAKNILKSELEVRPEAMFDMIKHIIETLKNESWVKIFVSEERYTSMIKADNTIIDILKTNYPNTKIIVSPDLVEDECHIETDDAMINASFDTQLENMQSALKKVGS